MSDRGTGTAGYRSSNGLRKDLIRLLVISAITVCVFVIAAEVYLRYTKPFNSNLWPAQFDVRFGYRYKPGAVSRLTNGVDFWAMATANSLGFPDREPPGEKLPGTCRVVFIGDSFVHALQVGIEQKSHVLFERMARKHLPSLNIETFAIGYGGTGQANQLAYYDVFAKPMSPDVVILVVVANDFVDNSPILKGMKKGWHPMHLPWLHFQRSSDGGGVSRIPPDPDWRNYWLSATPDRRQLVHRAAIKHSYFYHWLFTNLSGEYPGVAEWISGQSRSKGWSDHKRAIEQMHGLDRVFEGWDFPNDVNVSEMFFAKGPLPPVFEEALFLTGYALDEFVRRAREDNFRLIILATHGLSKKFDPGANNRHRRMLDRGGLQRLIDLVSPRGIPLVDQYDFITAQGGVVRDAHFSRDGHWSAQGHEWAAEAILDYFRQNQHVCAESGQI
jgi:hypothetical protein